MKLFGRSSTTGPGVEAVNAPDSTTSSSPNREDKGTATDSERAVIEGPNPELDTNAQYGVKKIEAATSIWTKKALILNYVMYVLLCRLVVQYQALITCLDR